MSSSDASDLVDSDESGVGEPPRKKRVLTQRTTSTGAKKPRLQRSGEAVGPGRTKGKSKAASSSRPAGRSRRRAGKSKPQSDHSSSSWHGSGDSSDSSRGGSGDDNGRPKRTSNRRGAASSRTVAPRPRRRLGNVKPGEGSHPKGRRRRASAVSDGVSAHSASRWPDSASSHVGTESDEDEVEFEFSSRPRRSKRTDAAQRVPGNGETAKRSDSRAELARSTRTKNPAGTASLKQSLDSSSDGDIDFRLGSPPAAVKTVEGPAGLGGSGKRGRVGGGGSSGATLAMPELSDDDKHDCLRDTDSDDVSAARGDDSDGPVLCRCGARHWQDGKRWIQCDARGCKTWEHLTCAYPVEGRPEGMSAPPEVHLCEGCTANGSSAAAGRARRGGRRCLTRCGDGAQPSPTKTSSDGTPDDDGGAGHSTVRRSQRVSGKEKRRVRLTKNVVGEDLSSSSSSEGVGVGPSGSLNDDRGLGASSDDDGFWAPEGHVETSQEYRCHCGGTLQSAGAVGGDGDGGNASGQWVQCHSADCGVWEHAACCDHGCALAPSAPGSATSRATRHWCRACDPRGRRHARWEEKVRKRLKRECRAAKGAGARERGRAAGAGSALADETRGAHGNEKNRVEERERALLGSVWRAVICGNASLLEELFREAGGGNERSDISVEGLLAARPPPIRCLHVRSRLSGGGDGGDREATDPGDDDPPVLDGYTLPTGLSLLMLAAGYWSNVADASTVPAAAVAAADTALVHTDSSAADNAPVVSAVRSVDPEPGAPGLSAVDSSPESTVPVASSATVDAVDEKTETEPPTQNEQERTDGGGSADLAGAAVPLASTEPSATDAASKNGLPQLGSEARLAVLRLVLERSGATAVLAADGEGRTAVHHAAAVNGAAEVELLLRGELGGAAALAKTHEGLTPLQVGAAVGHADACVALLRALPAPGTRAAVLSAATDGEDTSSGETALHLACLEGRAACVHAILREDDRLGRELADEMTGHVLNGIPAETPPTHRPLVLAKTVEGETPLMAAAGCPSSSCVELIIQNLQERLQHPGLMLAELRAVNRSGMNALHYAAGQAAEGSVEAAKAVLDPERSIACGQAPGQPRWDDPDAMINSGDNDNEASPLHLAAAISHKEMVTLLLSEGANSVLEDRQGWTPVMYADFDGRKEGAVLELLQHEPEKQLEALGRVLSSREGRNQSRIVEVVRNLVTVPSFFSLVNGFIRKKPASLLGSLNFLKNEPGLLDFENKRNLMRSLLSNPDEDTRNALNLVASPPLSGFGYSYDTQIYTRRGPGRALSALLGWMESAVRRWGESGLAAWLRVNRPSFIFEGEAGYGQGVDREGWEMVAGDLVLPFPPPPPPPNAATVTAGPPGAGTAATPATPNGDVKKTEAFFVQVDEGMSSYCPRDLRGDGQESGVEGAVGAGGGGSGGGCGGGGSAAVKAMQGRVERDKDLQAFELLGMVIGANLGWNKVLNLNLNPVVWKTILSRKVALSDLNLVDATYYKSLMQVQDMDGVDQLGLSFAYLDLKYCADSGGIRPDDDVTDENKALYASLALESRTFGRWRKQARALSRGLRRLVPLALLKMFTENELGLLLAGPGDIDPGDWERHTHFSGDATLKEWFWSVVRSLNKEERSLLLQFATGCSRLPAGGFGGLARTFKVMTIHYDDERPLPMAATCFYTLKLPRYPDLYSLRKYLLVAIRHGAAGFEFS